MFIVNFHHITSLIIGIRAVPNIQVTRVENQLVSYKSNLMSNIMPVYFILLYAVYEKIYERN